MLLSRGAVAVLAGWLALAVPVAAQTAGLPGSDDQTNATANPAGLPPSPTMPASTEPLPGEETPPAENTEEAAPEPQPTVEDISIEIIGPLQINRDAILAHLSLRQGTPYSQAQVDQSIRSLYETGLYEYIEGNREKLPDGGVRFILTILPKYRVSAVIFQGNKEYSKSRLSEEIKTEAGGVLDEVQVKRDTDKLFQFYQKKGYSRVKVSNTIDKNDNTGTGVVTFNIDEGPEVEIEAIKFVGNAHIKAGTLRDQMTTETYTWLISWFTGTGHYLEDTFQDDLDKLTTYYKNKGYLDVDIPENEVEFRYPAKDELVIVIHVHEGEQYHVGKVTVSGNTIFPTDRLMKLLTVKTGDVFSPAAIDKNSDTLRDYYGQYGYLDTVVRADHPPNLQTSNIDLNFVINESEKYFVEGINIQGNTKTRSSVIVRELALAPGDVFDTVRMKTSEDRLRNTRFFDTVDLAPEETNIPGRRDLRITVKEGKTGNLTFGAGFSTVESVVGYIELSQSNFDLFNYRNMFMGGGQKVRLRFSIGSTSNDVTFSFEEPWLWERELTLGFDLYRDETDYLSTTFNQVTTGFDVYLRKNLFQLGAIPVEGTLMYTLQDVQIKNVSLGAVPQIFQQQGHTSVSKVTVSLIRDDRNDILFPTDGTYFQLDNEIAGGPLWGQTNFYRVEGHADYWVPTWATGNQVASVSGRIGSILGYGGKSVPYSERYFLGGPYNLRGYSFRNVGPRDTLFDTPAYGQPTGGESYIYFSPEYSIEIINPIRFAVFYDVGVDNNGAFEYNLGNFQQDFGFGFRILLLGAPMRIDIGFPINPNQFQSNGPQFNFSFSTVF
jgi:outer membrane protein insertion porin family